MPKVRVSKESVKPPEALPESIYQYRLGGFKPKFSKDKGSINLNPQMKVINHPTLNGKYIFNNLNTKAGWILKAFVENLGLKMVEVGEDLDMPGEFTGPEDDPTKWVYRGPLLGRTGKVKVIQSDNTRGGIKNEIEEWLK